MSHLLSRSYAWSYEVIFYPPFPDFWYSMPLTTMYIGISVLLVLCLFSKFCVVFLYPVSLWWSVVVDVFSSTFCWHGPFLESAVGEEDSVVRRLLGETGV